MLQAFPKDIDIAIAHGSSGGALFNQKGEVAGVMTELIRSNFLDDWTLKDSGFLKSAAVSAHTQADDFRLTMDLLTMDEHAIGEPLSRGVLGVVPVTHPDILRGLGLDPNDVSADTLPLDGDYYTGSYTSGHCVEAPMQVIDTGVQHRNEISFEKTKTNTYISAHTLD